MIRNPSTSDTLCSQWFANLDDKRAQLLESFAGDLIRGDWQKVVDQLVEQTRSAPEQMAAWEFRGLFESLLGRHHQAIHSLETASILAPLHPLAARCLALEYYAIGRHSLGIDLLVGLAATTQQESLVRLLSHDLLKRRAHQAAIDMLFEKLDRLGDSAVLWHELSAALSQVPQRLLDSLTAVGRAIQLEPETASYRLTAAALLIRLEQPEQAFEVVSQLSETSIRQLKCPCCLWRLVNLYYWFEDIPRARICHDHWVGLRRDGHSRWSKVH